jgi:hypothetical protein
VLDVVDDLADEVDEDEDFERYGRDKYNVL